MNIDEAINRLNNCHPITKEDKEAFECAVQCMQFTKDFLPLAESPERMKQAINLLNSLEYAIDNVNHSGGNVYFTTNENKIKEFKVGRNRIDAAIERAKKYKKR